MKTKKKILIIGGAAAAVVVAGVVAASAAKGSGGGGGPASVSVGVYGPGGGVPNVPVWIYLAGTQNILATGTTGANGVYCCFTGLSAGQTYGVNCTPPPGYKIVTADIATLQPGVNGLSIQLAASVPALAVTLSIVPSTVASGSQAMLIVKVSGGSGGPYLLNFDFGDGTSANGVLYAAGQPQLVQPHTYVNPLPAPVTYTAKVAVIDTVSGLSSSASGTITVT